MCPNSALLNALQNFTLQKDINNIGAAFLSKWRIYWKYALINIGKKPQQVDEQSIIYLKKKV